MGAGVLEPRSPVCPFRCSRQPCPESAWGQELTPPLADVGWSTIEVPRHLSFVILPSFFTSLAGQRVGCMGNPEASPPFLGVGWAMRVLRDLWTRKAGRAQHRDPSVLLQRQGWEGTLRGYSLTGRGHSAAIPRLRGCAWGQRRPGSPKPHLTVAVPASVSPSRRWYVFQG